MLKAVQIFTVITGCSPVSLLCYKRLFIFIFIMLQPVHIITMLHAVHLLIYYVTKVHLRLYCVTGCKIKALRAKTNTYIKTPVRGEEPVFVVTGRREDVCAAKREILSAAAHFTQIRASRRGSSNSSFGSNGSVGPPSPLGPGQTTIHVPVPYKVVGLVVGPKGATIKRIQQQTHTYIVTPSRDKDPVFEVTGTPENVEAAKKEIEAHIAARTGGLVDTTNLPGHQQQPQHTQQLSNGCSVNGHTSTVNGHQSSPNGHHATQNGTFPLQNGHSQTSPLSRFSVDHDNVRRNGGAFAEEFLNNGHDSVFNDISGSLNGVGHVHDPLGFHNGLYMFGRPEPGSSNHFSYTTSSSNSHSGLVGGLTGDLVSRMSSSGVGVPPQDSSAFVFPQQDQFSMLNGFLQQNGQLLQTTNGFDGGVNVVDESCLTSIEPLLPSPPAWYRNGNARPSSFSSSRSVTSTSMTPLFNSHTTSCNGGTTSGASILHRRSNSFASVPGSNFSQDGDVSSVGGSINSAPSAARFSPSLLSDLVNGSSTPPLNETTSPTHGFSAAGQVEAGSESPLGEQHQSARRLRNDPLASGLQATFNGLASSSSAFCAFSSASITCTATPKLSSTRSDHNASPTPIDFVGLSLSDTLELLSSGEGSGDEHKSDRRCMVCSERMVVAALVPCGHNLFCMQCASHLQDMTEDKRICPACREPFNQAIRIRAQ